MAATSFFTITATVRSLMQRPRLVSLAEDGPLAPPGLTSMAMACWIWWSRDICNGTSKTSGVESTNRVIGPIAILISFGRYLRWFITTTVTGTSQKPRRKAISQNRGNGTFDEVGLISQAAVDVDGNSFAGMGVDFADYNNDGFPDLAVTTLAYQRFALFKNNGDDTFLYASQN